MVSQLSVDRAEVGPHTRVMKDVTQEDLETWIDSVSTLWGTSEDAGGDTRLAGEAMANVWSGFGYPDGPEDLMRMVMNATEIGYMIALRDLRAGDLDDEIRNSRLDELVED